MKKTMTLALFLLLITTLVGCGNTLDENNQFQMEFERLSTLIPTEFDDDIDLPFSNELDIVYFIDGLAIGNQVHYVLAPKDDVIFLEIQISNELNQESFYVSIKQLGDLEKYEAKLAEDNEKIDLLQIEFDRLKPLIPTEFNEDVDLPFSNEFDVKYFITEENIGSILEYTLSPTDINLSLEVQVSSGSLFESFYISVTQLGDAEAYEAKLSMERYQEIVSAIDQLIPDVMTSNIDVPPANILGASVEYRIDCTTVVRERYIYFFPTQDETCIISALIDYENESKREDFTVIMKSIDNLPKIPEIYITTDNNQEITSKDEYVTGEVTLVLNGYTQRDDLEGTRLKIRLRGNSTSVMPKKAYKIKFYDKTEFLSDYREKDWLLIANYVDHTLIRNSLAYYLSSNLNLGFTPRYVFADVYLNGVYQGNYMITDQIEVTNDRVDIEENEPVVDTGYLVELDIGLYREGLENTDDNFFLIDNIPFVLHSPDNKDDHYLSEQKQFIKDYFVEVLDTLKNKQDYSQLIDEESFIDWYIVNELFKNVDAGYSSVYFNKDKGGLLKMGPVWDFDLSTGNPGYLYDRGPEGWYVGQEYKNIFYFHLLQYPEFRENLKNRWNEIYESEILTLLPKIHSMADAMTYSRYQNFILWEVIGIDQDWYTAPEIYDLKTYDEQVWFLYDYLATRMEWMNEEFNK